MAAFSYQHQNSASFLIDSVFFPTHPNKMSVFLEEPNNTSNNTNSFAQFYQSNLFQEIPAVDATACESSSSAWRFDLGNIERRSSVAEKQSNTDSSSVVLDKLESGEQITQKVIPMDKKRKTKDGSSFNSAQSKDAREVKGKKQKKCNNNTNVALKDVEEKKGKGENKRDNQKKVSAAEEAPKGYIHVRARRGQATDNHSLAERVRREKISERMKLLQALVPGCDKVTGKALMLDEIINYVQSLQNQVEFLSMKLAYVNPMFYDFGMDLDSIMVKPEPNVQQCSPTTTQAQPTAFHDTANTFPTTANNYPLVDSSAASLLFQQGNMLNSFSQSNGQLLWDVDEQQKQKLMNQLSGFSNNLCAFH